MAFKKAKENTIFFIALVITVTVIPLVATQNIDCKGKAFHCVNSTHFKICVDLGGGISTTVDDFVIPCPKNTVCKGSNYFECEYIGTTTLKPTQKSEESSDISATPTLKNADLATTFYNNTSENKLSQIVVSTTPSSTLGFVDYTTDSVLSNTTSDLSDSGKHRSSETKFAESTTENEGLTSKTTKVTLDIIDNNDKIKTKANFKSIEISNTPDIEIKITIPDSNFSKSPQNYYENPNNQQLPVTIYKIHTTTDVFPNRTSIDFTTDIAQGKSNMTYFVNEASIENKITSVSNNKSINLNINSNVNNLIETENISLSSYHPYNLTNVTTDKINYLKNNRSGLSVQKVINNELTQINKTIKDPSVELTYLNLRDSMTTSELYENTEISETVKYIATNKNIFYDTATITTEAENLLSTVKNSDSNINDSHIITNTTSTSSYNTTEVSNLYYTTVDILQNIDKSSLNVVKPLNDILSSDKLLSTTEPVIIKSTFTPNIDVIVDESTVTALLIENVNNTQSNNSFSNVTLSPISSLKLNENKNNPFVSYTSYTMEPTLKPQTTSSQSYILEQSSLSSKLYNNAMGIETIELTSITSDLYTSKQDANSYTTSTLYRDHNRNYIVETKSNNIPFKTNFPDGVLTRPMDINIIENMETTTVKSEIPLEAFTTMRDNITEVGKTITENEYEDITYVSTNSFMSTDKTTSDIGIDINNNEYETKSDNLSTQTDHYISSNESEKNKYIELTGTSTIYPIEFSDSIKSTILDKITIEDIKSGNNITDNEIGKQEDSYNNLTTKNKNQLANTQIRNDSNVTDLFNITENIDIGIHILDTTIQMSDENTNKNHTDTIVESTTENLIIPEIKIIDNFKEKDISLKHNNDTQTSLTKNVVEAKHNSQFIFSLTGGTDIIMNNNFTAQDTYDVGIDKNNQIKMPSRIKNTKQANINTKDSKIGSMHIYNESKITDTKYAADVNVDTTYIFDAVTVKNKEIEIPYGIIKDSDLKVSQKDSENIEVSKQLISTTTDVGVFNDDNITKIHMHTLDKANLTIANYISNETLSGLNINKENNIKTLTNLNNTKQSNISTKDNKEGSMHIYNESKITHTKHAADVNVKTTDAYDAVTVKNKEVEILHGIIKDSDLKVSQNDSENIEISKKLLSTTTDVVELSDDNITKIHMNTLDKTNLTTANSLSNETLFGLNINKENNIQILTKFNNTKQTNINTKDSKIGSMHIYNESKITDTKYAADVNVDTTDVYGAVTVKNKVVEIPHGMIKESDIKVTRKGSENIEISKQLLSPTTYIGELSDDNITKIHMNTLDKSNLTTANSISNETLSGLNINKENNIKTLTNLNNIKQSNISTKDNKEGSMHIYNESKITHTKYAADVNVDTTDVYDAVTVKNKEVEIPHGIIKDSDLKVSQNDSENIEISKHLISTTTYIGELNDHNITKINMNILDKTNLTTANSISNETLLGLNTNKENNIQIQTNFNNTKQANINTKNSKVGSMHMYNESKITDTKYAADVNVDTTDVYGAVTVKNKVVEIPHGMIKESDIKVTRKGSENIEISKQLLSPTTYIGELSDDNITKIHMNTLDKSNLTTANSISNETLSGLNINKENNIKTLTNLYNTKQSNISTKDNKEGSMHIYNESKITHTKYAAHVNVNTTDVYDAVTVKNKEVEIPHGIIKDSDLKVSQNDSENIEISKHLISTTTYIGELNDHNITKINMNILDKTNLTTANSISNETLLGLNTNKENNIQIQTNFNNTKQANINTKNSKVGSMHMYNESKITDTKYAADVNVDTTDVYGAVTVKNKVVEIPHAMIKESDIKVTRKGSENIEISKQLLSPTTYIGELSDDNITKIHMNTLDKSNLTTANSISNETLSGLNINKENNIKTLTNLNNTKQSNISTKDNKEGSMHIYNESKITHTKYAADVNVDTTDVYDAVTVKNKEVEIPLGIIEDSDLKVSQNDSENIEISKHLISTTTYIGELNDHNITKINMNILDKTNLTTANSISNETLLGLNTNKENNIQIQTNFNNTKQANINTKNSKVGSMHIYNESKITDTKYAADVNVDTTDIYDAVTVKNKEVEIPHGMIKESDLKVSQEGIENTYISIFNTYISEQIFDNYKSENTKYTKDFIMDTTVSIFSATRIAENIVNDAVVNDGDKIKILTNNNSDTIDFFVDADLVLPTETINIGANNNGDSNKNILGIKGDVYINQNQNSEINKVTQRPSPQSSLKYDLISQRNSVSDSTLSTAESITISATTNIVNDVLFNKEFITSHLIDDKAVTQNIPETLKYDFTTLPYVEKNEATHSMKHTNRINTEGNKNVYGSIYTKEHSSQVTSPVTHSLSVTTHNIGQVLAPPPIDILTPFTCKIRNHGKYPDENDCSKFYLCIGKSSPITGKCPSGTVFSDIKKQCSNNLSHCIRNNQFRCLAEGRFIDVLSNDYYYICAKSKKGFVRFKLKCQEGYYLNKNSVHCLLRETSFEDDSKNTSESRTRESTSSETFKSTKTFICIEEGKFEFPEDCRKYYVCTQKSSEFRRRLKRCDSDEVFDRDKKKCVDEESYECRF